MNFHPINKAFWMPIAWAIPGGLFGVAIGWFTTESIRGAALDGLYFAVITWIIVGLFWLDILAKTYQPGKHSEPVVHPTESRPAGFYVQCDAETGTTHSLGDYLPVPKADLEHYANGVIFQQRPMTVREWLPTFKPEIYADLMLWMVQRGYAADMGERKTPELTDRGRDILTDISKFQIVEYLPSGLPVEG